MYITGQHALDNIVDNKVYQEQFSSSTEKEVKLDDMFAALDKHVTDNTFMSLKLVIDGGVDQGGTTLSIETNIINLPLRYTNQLKKLIWPEKEDNEINVYMIVEDTWVSQSNLIIALASSVSAYNDDSDSVKYKISEWFTAQLEHIAAKRDEAALETDD